MNGGLTSKPDPIQFGKAEPSEERGGPASCRLCSKPLDDVYFDVNGELTCESCRYSIETQLAQGAGFGGLMKALFAGSAAAVVGSGIYYAVLALTGYEVGLVAIVVGFLVGGAVRWGSSGRGGWFYQALAMGLTYMAIVSTYVPFIIEAWQKEEAQPAESAQPAGEAATGGDVAENKETENQRVSSSEPGSAPGETPTPGQLAVALAAFVVLVAAVPFLAGFENIIGILIIGFALYEAWKLNRRRRLIIEGPFRMGKSGPGVPVASTP